MTTKVTIEDCRQAGHCPVGIRRWFEHYEFDFRDFLHNGIDEQVFLATGDAHAERIIKLKHEREANG